MLFAVVFIFILFVIHIHLHRPRYHRDGTITKEGVRMFKIQPPSFSAMVTHDQPEQRQPAAQTQSSAIVPRYCVAVAVA